ncbi:uncharacterized protein haspin isoform X2 [Stegostoma tigrinum]|uniref:uncharacterized protein haspin isoform X2 n=1 Tax=Stegostoma tigrinum TaxID=3053191 RepID=UPI00202B29F4|nr:uncharacterized protein haspin isoform X2 [Stegostoma tigrinum]
MMKTQAGGRPALVRTYGKYRQRTVKAPKWLSPETGREHLFSSSDSIDNSGHSSSSSNNPSFKSKKKRKQKVLLNVSNAKATAKKNVGKPTNSKSHRKKQHSYVVRGRGVLRDKNYSSLSTEDECRENCMFTQDKENYFVPVTSSRMEGIIKESPNLKYVTYRRKLRNCKTMSNQLVNTQLQMKTKELLGSLIESSESSISFNKPKKACRISCEAQKFKCNSRAVKKLDRSPLQTSTPSCTRKSKLKEPSRCIISFNGEIEHGIWKNNAEAYNEESIDHPSTVGTCCTRSSNTSCKAVSSTEHSNNSEFVGLSPEKLGGICSLEADCKPVASASLEENLEHIDSITSHLFQPHKDDFSHTLHSTFNNSVELFSHVTEDLAVSPQADLVNGVDDPKVFVRNSLVKSGLLNYTSNLDLVTEQEHTASKNIVSKLSLQPVVQLDYFSVFRYFRERRSVSPVEDDSSKVSSSQGTTAKKQRVINRLHEKLTSQKSGRSSFSWVALQPNIVLSPLELKWQLPTKKVMTNPVKRSLADGSFNNKHDGSFHLLGKMCRQTDCMNLKSSLSSMYSNSQDGKSGKESTADADCFKHTKNQQNRKTISMKDGYSLKANCLSGQRNLLSDNASNIFDKPSSFSDPAFQKNTDLASVTVKSAEKSTVDLYGHPEPQMTEIKNLKSTLMSSSVSTPLGSRNWSRFKAAHSIHKRKKVIVTPLRSDCTMSLQSTPDSTYLPRTENFNDRSLNKLVSMANFSATPLRNRMRGSRRSLMEKWPPVLQPVFLTDEEKVYCECQQNGPVSFKECIPSTMLEKCEKIGEGIFGEVFQMTNNDGKYMVFKIIPIEGGKLVNGEPQKKFEEVLPEIIISKQLSQLSEESENCTNGFITLHSVHCVKDSYPLELLKAWDKYNQAKSSENDRPDESCEEQLYIIFEFENGGYDLESMRTKIPSLESARSVLHQVTASLAVAENALNFEHRDLHWGNVLIKKTAIKQIEYKLCGKTFNIDTHGFVANIIDYTLSRMGTDDVVHFCDLSSEESFFCGQGDYQFEIYRKMKEENLNNWAEYNPHTNVLWLHYLADKMLSIQYKKRNTKVHRILKETFKEFTQECLEYQCAVDVLTSAQLFQKC